LPSFIIQISQISQFFLDFGGGGGGEKKIPKKTKMPFKGEKKNNKKIK
jgi:hypothetical protein